MIYETVDLYRHFRQYASPSEGAGTLTCYRTSVGEIRPKLRPAVLVLPGGGYEFLSAREKEPIALKFLAAGFNVYVLAYSLAPVSYPAQLREAAMAIAYIRECAEEHGTDDERVAAIGFSAGGHLAGCISFLWDDPALMRRFGAECAKIRPDLCILSYPVVTADPQYRHAGSFDHFCAGIADQSAYSLENSVRPSAPPCFIWATSDDSCVPVENSVRLYSALCRAGVPAEFHAFEHGAHGMSVCTRDVTEQMTRETEHVARWVDLSKEFLNAHDFIPVALRQRSE